MELKIRSLIIFWLFITISITAHTKNFILNAEPLSCISAVFSNTQSLVWDDNLEKESKWYNISLKITNTCDTDINFQNSQITFNNTQNLNTSFWGDFWPLSYPDNNLQITSQALSAGGYLSSLKLHMPEASWANSILKKNAYFVIKYGAAVASYDPASVKVYVGNVVATGSVGLTNNSPQPANITQSYALINLVRDNQTTTVQVPWSNQKLVPNLALGNYVIQALDINDSQGNTYKGSAFPSTISVVANQVSTSVISYSKVLKLGKIIINTPSLPNELAGYTGAPNITLTRSDNNTSLSQSIAWGGATTIQNLEDNISYNLSASVIAYNNYTCVATFNPTKLISNASTPPTAQLNYACSKASGGKILAYVPGWKAPPSASSLKAAGYTHISVAFGVFSTSQPGQIISAFDTVTKEYINSCHQAGLKVLLSLGGASTSISGTSVDFHQVLSLASSPVAFQNTFVNSAQSLITQYGFDGIDIDIEHGLNGSGTFAAPTGDIAVMANILNSLRQNNPSLIISLTPQVANVSPTSGFDGTWGNYASLIMQTYQALSFVGIQIYNTGCAYGIDHVCYADLASSPDLSVAMAAGLLENWPQKDSSGRATGFQPYISYLNPSQIILGYPAPDNQGISDGLPVKPTSVIKRAIQCLRTGIKAANSCDSYVPPRTYTAIGGVFEWEATFDQANNFRFAADLKACVLTGLCKE